MRSDDAAATKEKCQTTMCVHVHRCSSVYLLHNVDGQQGPVCVANVEWQQQQVFRQQVYFLRPSLHSIKSSGGGRGAHAAALSDLPPVTACKRRSIQAVPVYAGADRPCSKQGRYKRGLVWCGMAGVKRRSVAFTHTARTWGRGMY